MAHARVYIGNGGPFIVGGRRSDRRYRPGCGWYVLGFQFGPMLYANVGGLEEAIDEFDERHGTRVDWQSDASTLADYEPDASYLRENPERGETEARAVAAMNAGDIRMNDGGTEIWVDPYEWCEGPFPTLSAALTALGRTSL